VTPARILVIGAGAREHVLAWRLARDAGVAEVHVAPGNAGMSDVATVHAAVSTLDLDALARLVDAIEADLVVIGPEAPLAAGVADRLSAAGRSVFGPSQSAAALETSKAFCRRLADEVGVPMADGASFGDAAEAARFARALAVPVAVKADGLAAGKGVTLCRTLGEAEAAIRALGPRVIVERLLEGPEASLMAICDGERAVALPVARDYKRVGDGDVGPNTGGMGAYSPLPDLDDASAERLLDVFHRPVLAEMARRGTPFRGVLYAGLLLAADGPRLLEFNVRFGDPEAQVILPRVHGNLAALLAAAAAGRLDDAPVAVSAEAAVAVVLAARGYPTSPQVGDAIGGIDAAVGAGSLVFHGATAVGAGGWQTAGGRALTVVGRGVDMVDARRRAYEAAGLIGFEGMHYRSDIAAPALAEVGA
jgi:phosphoribosylamine--glycine ligase